MSISLLYLSEDYSTSKVHHELLKRLCDNDITATLIYTNRPDSADLDIKKMYKDINYTTYGLNIAKNELIRFRLDFGYKIDEKVKFVENNVRLKFINLIHAATLFSEGAVAYKLHKKYGIPYTLTVRGTDINVYMKYMPHLWPLARKILKNASFVIWSSSAVEKRTISHFICFGDLKHSLKNVSVLIHNGVEDYWIDHCDFSPRSVEPSKLLYIGNFTPNKNVPTLMKAVEMLSKEGYNLHLTLVGGGGTDQNKVLGKCEELPNLFTFNGRIVDHDKLKAIFKENDLFTMVSHSETFGLVYIEALSQNLPILYTRGQGFDGVLDTNIGEAVSSRDVRDIKQGIKKLLLNYPNYATIEANLQDFSWATVMQKYNQVFNEALSKGPLI